MSLNHKSNMLGSKGFFVYLISMLVILSDLDSQCRVNATDDDEVMQKFDNVIADFSARFFCELAHGDRQRSLIASPLGVILSLTPFVLFSEGKTYYQLRDVLHVDKEFMIRAIPQFLKMLSEDQNGTAELELATNLFYHEPFILTENFKIVLLGIGTLAEKLNFTNTNLTVKFMNHWISTKTRGIINYFATPKMFQYPSTMLLVNTIYFKDSWNSQIPCVKSGIFRSSRGAKEIDYLTHTGMYEFFENSPKDYRILVKRYNDPKFACTFILPDSWTGLLELISDIAKDDQLIGLVRQKYKTVSVKVSVPALSIQNAMDAGLILEGMGIKNLYTDPFFKGILKKPNGMSDDHRVEISKVIQGAHFVMNQNGTQGVVGLTGNTTPANDEVEEFFTADHPYLFVITREKTILFMGCFDGND